MNAVAEAAVGAPQALIDPRVAKHGGTRKNAKSAYTYPGMTDEASWRRAEVHQHTYGYWCGLCGQRFAGPHAYYTHSAKRHDR
jgi:hypothetical protein